MHFRTEIQTPVFPFKLQPQQAAISLGSCFSENMAQKLKRYGITVADNPFGTSYNPISLASQLQRLINPAPYQPDNLLQYNQLWFSFDHYTLFSNTNREECLNTINQSLGSASALLPSAGTVLITLGTAHAWLYKESGKIVNNCHQIPANRFERVLLKPNQIINEFLPIIQHLEIHYPELKIIFSVSPVRHWRDGASGNQRSKSILHVAVHELVDQFRNAHYFPAYELLMDDLRDYRFYADDLLHPSAFAVNYIWNKFSAAMFDDEALAAIEKYNQILKQLEHRPKWPQSDAYQKLIDDGLKKVAICQKQWPAFNWHNLSAQLISLKL